jgi:hypothetical protein
VPDRRVLRLATALLLALIAIDLAAVHTCALYIGAAPGPAHTSLVALDGPGAPAHQHPPLHPDHCFCHGLSTGADSAPLPGPFQPAGAVPETPHAQLLRVPTSLYHPPQLTA